MTNHDDDPTGMRALLRGLPDPGPMPEDLVQRIQSALADLPALDRLESENTDGDGADNVSRGTVTPAQRSWWGRHAGLAAVAAVVLLGGGAVASQSVGIFGSGNDDMTASSGSAGGQPETLSDSRADADAPRDSATSNEGGARLGALGQVVVRHSARNYTTADLSAQAGDVRSGPTTAPLTSESPGIGPIGTEIGVRSCLTALDVPHDAAADVDLASLDGRPAAVIVVTLGGKRTAYAVGRNCTLGNPSLLVGPVTLP